VAAGQAREPQRRPRTSHAETALQRLWRVLRRLLRHPVYAASVAAVLLRHPRLVRAGLRGGWRAALLAHCIELCPVAADLLTPYEAGFFGQVFLFDEYEVGRLPLPAAPTVVDVGANVGFFSWRVAALRPAARLLAFEPASDNHARLARIFEALGIHGEACRLACGASSGTARLFLRSSVTHSLDATWHDDLDRGAGSEEVALTTLDLACAARGLSELDLLKIDTEGAEGEVLAGAAGILAHTRFVVLEYHSGERREACLHALEAAGFRCRIKRFWGAGAAGGQEGLLLCRRAAGRAAAAAPAAP